MGSEHSGLSPFSCSFYRCAAFRFGNLLPVLEELLQGVVELLFELRFVQRVCVSNAQDCFFAKLVAAMNTTHDQFQRMRGMIPFPDPFASGLDNRGDQVNDARCQTDACRDVHQQLGAAFMFFKSKTGVARGQLAQALVDQFISAWRMLSVKTS